MLREIKLILKINTISYMCFQKFKMFRNFTNCVNFWIMLKTCESFLEKHVNSEIEYLIDWIYGRVDF